MAFATSASALFWATIVLVVLTIAILAVTAVAWRSSLIKRRLLCNMTSCTRLLTAPEPVPKGLEISFEGQPINDPYVVGLEIANVGRTAIPSELFDKGRGLTFVLGAPILKTLTVEHEPASAPVPVFSVTSDICKLQPELIVKGEVIRLSLLAAAPVNNVYVGENPLADVSVQVRDRQAWLAQRARRRNIPAVLSGAIASVVFMPIGIYALQVIGANWTYTPPSPLRAHDVLIACHNVHQTVDLMRSAMRSAYSQIRVTRDSAGHLSRIGFGSSYEAQAAIVSTAWPRLMEAYILVTHQMPGLKFIAIQEKIAAASDSFKRLPAEGAGPNANRDLQLTLAGLKAVSNGQLTPSSCNNS